MSINFSRPFNVSPETETVTFQAEIKEGQLSLILNGDGFNDQEDFSLEGWISDIDSARIAQIGRAHV